MSSIGSRGLASEPEAGCYLSIHPHTAGRLRILKIGEVELQLDGHRLLVRGTPVHLPHKEFLILQHLMSNAGRVVTRRELLDKRMGADRAYVRNYLEVHIRRLRMKVENDADRPTHIRTIRGVGYISTYQKAPHRAHDTDGSRRLRHFRRLVGALHTRCGTGGCYAAQLSERQRDHLRIRCEQLLPPAPFAVHASAWGGRAVHEHCGREVSATDVEAPRGVMGCGTRRGRCRRLLPYAVHFGEAAWRSKQSSRRQSLESVNDDDRRWPLFLLIKR